MVRATNATNTPLLVIWLKNGGPLPESFVSLIATPMSTGTPAITSSAIWLRRRRKTMPSSDRSSRVLTRRRGPAAGRTAGADRLAPGPAPPDPVACGPVPSGLVGTNPFGAGPVGAGAVGAIPVGTVPVGGVPFGAVPVGAAPPAAVRAVSATDIEPLPGQ